MELRFDRILSDAHVHPFDAVRWAAFRAVVKDSSGKTIFEQHVTAPDFWSQQAVNVVASKYLRKGEDSVRQLLERVTMTIYEWAQTYFEDVDMKRLFIAELQHLLVHQYAAFNSPVYFNLGVPNRRQAVSACYINSVADTMESILELAKTEGLLFRDGSGSGTDLSQLRGSNEALSAGGYSSGPISFMRGLDALGGAMRSGGTTRRAAIMRVLGVDHPNIREFIACKAEAEKRAHALIDAGFSSDFAAEWSAYDTVPFQNANHSVRVSDSFMGSVQNGNLWELKNRVNKRVASELPARELYNLMAEAAWFCGDPGIQYDKTINDWNTCPNSGRINASNPCSEYVFLDDTACNLASLNLLKFQPKENFNIPLFKHAVDIMITAQEVLVGNASYPTAQIAANSRKFRPLGLGYANLGALLMRCGWPYDSNDGRNLAASITALMGGEAYLQSARIAQSKGAFGGYAENTVPMLRVIDSHKYQADLHADVQAQNCEVAAAACVAWDEAQLLGSKHGFRNAQVTVLAPTGTIAFMMDCATTGIEPETALVKEKRLVGGGTMKIVNQEVETALRLLNYGPEEIEDLLMHLEDNGHFEGSILHRDDMSVFDTSFGKRTIDPMGHVKMMAAVQPFLSGAISKTVNLPNDATVQDIKDIYLRAWQLGLKAIAVYRDGCKKSQPLAAISKMKCNSCGLESMQPAGTCKRCENCGSTTGCS